MHNVMNALATFGAAGHVGINPDAVAAALKVFKGVKRRMEVRGVVNGITVYDDFAHHPTAIETTLKGLRARVGAARIIAVLEPRSNTMKMGVHSAELAPSLATADQSWFFAPKDLGWDLAGAVGDMGNKAKIAQSVDELVSGLASEAKSGDNVLIMSNGGFGGLHDKLLAALRK
jgi:UDP-N-acetylmuramate: L-alanyl-gamma-D-glutamyl-meso-diaminopimelate ligase